MRNISIISLFLIGGLLVGCSSKPNVDDIAPQLKKAWGMCQGLKLGDLKKTNGIDRGETYEMVVSYRLQITRDVTAQEAWYTEAICPSPGMLQLLWVYGKIDQKFGHPLKIGEIINVNETFTMINSEKGWIIQ